jgi:hypothetical protein
MERQRRKDDAIDCLRERSKAETSRIGTELVLGAYIFTTEQQEEGVAFDSTTEELDKN